MWTVTATQSEGSWLDDVIIDVITHELPPLPPHDQHIGHVETHWHQTSPGIAHVVANPEEGTPDDRRLAEAIIMEQLRPYGFKRAVVEMVWDHSDITKQAAWGDIEDKARRLVTSGNVQVLRNGYNSIIGQVQGDHGNYRTEIARDDPNSQAITGSHCQCDWGQFQNLPRTREWKRFQNRPCAHILATYWQAKGTPIDEDRAPGNYGEPGQMSLFDQGGSAPNTQTPMWQNYMQQQQQSPMNPPGAAPAGGGAQVTQAPAPEDVLPLFPMDQSMMPEVNPSSIPGGRPGPTPTNPLQYPGGTFSSIHTAITYQNGDKVRLKKETVGQYQGRPESGMAGEAVTVPAGSIGEVLGTMGQGPYEMVNVLWMGGGFDQMSYFEPFGATFWCFASELDSAPGPPPGPAIRRT